MNHENLPTKFYNVGLSYKKADVRVRGTFSISKENQKRLLEEAKRMGIEGIFVLSTCNRTEITGFAKHPFQLISLLIKYSKGSVEEFIDVSNVYKNRAAVQHLFNIGTGLDSQILGDYEIVGQLKEAFKLAKKMGTTNAYMERLMNLVLQASKEVKNKTKLSSGTTSVSYAAIQYIVDNVADLSTKNVLIYGLGEIGKNTCKNVLEYTKNRNVTLINRTRDKAEAFQKLHSDIKVVPHDLLKEQIDKSDVLIVSTGASKPTICAEHIPTGKELLILDLSMPENVDLELKNNSAISLVNVDELSVITNKTIAIRQAEVPAANKIIDKYKSEFEEWISHRKFVPAVNALKASLTAIQNEEIDFHAKKLEGFNTAHAEFVTSRMIQKITTQFVKHLKSEHTAVDQSISVMKQIFNQEKVDL